MNKIGGLFMNERRGIPVDMDVITGCDCSFLSQPYVYIID